MNCSVSTTLKQMLPNAMCFFLLITLFQSISKVPPIKSSNCEKLLGIYIDSNFWFEYHINRICRKASQKLHALSRIVKYISEDKKHMLFKSFTILQFNYCPIVWMCHGRGLNKKINNIQERALRIVYQDKKSPTFGYWVI